jgi:hypothetical protein
VIYLLKTLIWKWEVVASVLIKNPNPWTKCHFQISLCVSFSSYLSFGTQKIWYIFSLIYIPISAQKLSVYTKKILRVPTRQPYHPDCMSYMETSIIVPQISKHHCFPNFRCLTCPNGQETDCLPSFPLGTSLFALHCKTVSTEVLTLARDSSEFQGSCDLWMLRHQLPPPSDYFLHRIWSSQEFMRKRGPPCPNNSLSEPSQSHYLIPVAHTVASQRQISNKRKLID